MDLITYILNEAKNKRIEKMDAARLIHQCKSFPQPHDAPHLHPLLHRNTSTVFELGFGTTLRGDEFFLADHVVQGKRVLPGVAYLEMAREAALRMDGAAAEAGEIGVRLTNTVWIRPAVAEDGAPLELRIALSPDDDNGGLAFEIYSGDDENRVHSQGSAELFSLPETEHLDLERLRSQCDRGVLTGAECYAEFAAA
ncbi:MAG: polyketide synthase dehydratase domain-containing protein, partial [Alphaproteobacteria bacterium]